MPPSSPSISYIVSCHNRPDHLAGVLASLKVQTEPDFEALVMDNSEDPRMVERNMRAIEFLEDGRFRHYWRQRDYPQLVTPDCYTAGEVGVKLAHGEFLCFPSDDGYYMPTFGATMLRAARANSWELVYCDCHYDCSRWGAGVRLLQAKPEVGSIDKTNFILRRERFTRFPGKIPGQGSASDGLLIEALVRSGIAHGKVPEVLCVHN